MDLKHPLAQFREERGWTMTRLAAELGVGKDTVSRWESGQRFPGRELWPRIRELTGLGIEQLADVTRRDAAE